MHKLKSTTPLGGDSCRIDQFKGLSITERDDLALASVAIRRGQSEAATEEYLGFKLPAAGKWSADRNIAALWTGPGQWFLQAPHDTHELLADQVRTAVGASASVTEQTDGWCQFDVDGMRCPDVFERLCNVDIRRMEKGDVTRTQLEHLGCFIKCNEAGESFSVMGPRASAASLHHALLAAAHSVM